MTQSLNINMRKFYITTYNVQISIKLHLIDTDIIGFHPLCVCMGGRGAKNSDRHHLGPCRGFAPLPRSLLFSFCVEPGGVALQQSQALVPQLFVHTQQDDWAGEQRQVQHQLPDHLLTHGRVIHQSKYGPYVTESTTT